MTEHICSCGRPIPAPFNSTIYPKLCPSCDRIKRNKALLTHSYQSREKVAKKGCNEAGGKKKSPRQCAMDRADEYFSKYIRLKYSFESCGELVCKCYTCSQLHGIKETECGHWQRRGYKTTRYHLDDARPQCTKCNKWHSGEPEKFEINLIRDIGRLAVDELKLLAQERGEDNEAFYRGQATKYRKLFNQLLKEKGVENPWKK
jgi:hypothetical protein